MTDKEKERELAFPAEKLEQTMAALDAADVHLNEAIRAFLGHPHYAMWSEMAQAQIRLRWIRGYIAEHFAPGGKWSGR